MASPTNEQSKKKAEEELIAGIPSNAFDSQVLLLDAFIGNLKAANVEIYNGEAVKDYAKNVPFSTRASQTINNLAFVDQENLAKVQKYVDDIRPIDLAQMLPDIRLEIINGTTYETVFVVPLADPGNIQEGFSAPGYYSTKTVGLKSLELFLDGSDNPFFGKTYNVNMQLVFDSVNTFFSTAAGSDLTYAQIFRSSGKVASGDYFTRLTLGMASENESDEFKPPLLRPESIEQKYNLKDPVMTLLLNLQLVKTKIQIDQNLRTIVTVDYISQEEGMFKSQEVFDFLGLDLKDAQADLKKELEGIKKEKLALEEAARLYHRQKVDDKAQEIASSENQELFGLKRDHALLEELQKRSSGGQVVMQVPAGIVNRYFTGDEVTTDEIDIEDVLEKSNEKLKEVQKQINDAKEELEELKKKDSRKIFEKEFGERSFQEIEEKLLYTKNRFANIRLDQITAAIDAILNDPELYIGDNPAIRTISLSAEEIRDYYFQDTNIGYDSVKRRRLNKDPNANKGTSKPFNKNNPNPKTREQATKEMRERKFNPSKFFSEKSKDNEKISRGEGNLSIGTVDAIVKSLSAEKNIQYILLGDFIRLLIRRIYTIRTNQIIKGQILNPFFGGKEPLDKLQQYKAILDKTSILLSQIKFKNMESRNADITKNIYSIPISVSHITHIIAKSTFGKSKNFFTIFEMIEKLINLISNSRRRKANILNVVDYAGSFSISKRTYALAGNINSPTTIRIAGQGDDPKNTIHGVVFHAKRVKETTPETALKPVFVFGGVDRGIVLDFAIESLQDDSFAKMIDEELQKSADGGENSIIPVMFKCQIQTFPAFFLQLGSIFSVVAPSLDIANSQFFLQGDYRVMSIKHTWTAGSTFKTSLAGYMDSTNTKTKTSSKPTKTSEEQRDIIKVAGIDKLQELKQKKAAEMTQAKAIQKTLGGLKENESGTGYVSNDRTVFVPKRGKIY